MKRFTQKNFAPYAAFTLYLPFTLALGIAPVPSTTYCTVCFGAQSGFAPISTGNGKGQGYMRKGTPISRTPYLTRVRVQFTVNSQDAVIDYKSGLCVFGAVSTFIM